jgi:hypothetical protein
MVAQQQTPSGQLREQLLTALENTQITKSPWPHMRLTNVFAEDDYQALADRWPLGRGDTMDTGRYRMGAGGGTLWWDLFLAFRDQQVIDLMNEKFITDLDVQGHRSLMVEDANTFTIGPHTDVRLFSFHFYGPSELAVGETEGKLSLMTMSIPDEPASRHYAFDSDVLTELKYDIDPNSIVCFPATGKSWHGVRPMTQLASVRRVLIHMYLDRVTNQPTMYPTPTTSL